MKPSHHRIIELHKAGLPIDVIAERVFLGTRTVQNVVCKAIKDGVLEPRRQTSRTASNDEIVRRILAGGSQAGVARALGISASTVAGVMFRYRSKTITHPEAANDLSLGAQSRAV